MAEGGRIGNAGGGELALPRQSLGDERAGVSPMGVRSDPEPPGAP